MCVCVCVCVCTRECVCVHIRSLRLSRLEAGAKGLVYFVSVVLMIKLFVICSQQATITHTVMHVTPNTLSISLVHPLIHRPAIQQDMKEI